MGATSFEPEDRVRHKHHDFGDALTVGTGEVTGFTPDGGVRVRYDSAPWVNVVEKADDLVPVTVVCSYKKQRWEDGDPFGIDGMILLCDLHGRPAAGACYEVDDPTTVTDRCDGPWT